MKATDACSNTSSDGPAIPPKHLLSLDFGGTKQAVGLLRWPSWEAAASQAAVWEAIAQQPTPRAGCADEVFAAMLHLADAVLAEHKLAPDAVGASFNGPMDLDAGRPRACHHLAGWEGFPLRDRLAAHYHAPTVVENDATAAALGEWRFGAGQGCASLLYVTVSTGVGGGLILDGRLYRGRDSMAGEVGHLCVDPHGPLCPCGRRGCLEAVAAGPAIVRRLDQLQAQQPSLPCLLRGKADYTSRDVAEAAAQGDVLAQAALQDSAQALGRAIGGLLNVLNLERVIVGGGVMGAGEFYLGWVRETAERTALAGVHVDIRPAALGAEAPLWGAAALALSPLEESA